MERVKFLSKRITAMFIVFRILMFAVLLRGFSHGFSPAITWIFVFLLITEALLYIIFAVIPFKKLESKLEEITDSGKFEQLLEIPVDFSEGARRYKYDIIQELDRQEVLKLSVRQSELIALQNQINPHFLYNTLEAIRSDAIIFGVDSIAETTEALADFFRYTISSLDSLVTLAEELHNVETYFVIQKYRFADNINLEISVDKELHAEQLFMPKMLMQPLVENAIVHGLETKKHMGTVSIDITQADETLQINVRDDGIGMDYDTVERLNRELRARTSSDNDGRRGGIALRNVHERITLLFGNEYGIRVFSVPFVGTEVRATIPICKEAQL